VIQFWPLLL